MIFHRFLILLLLISLLAGCTFSGSSGPAADIVATTMPVYTFTTRLCAGTDLHTVQLVTESVSCLHDYTLQVSQMRLLENADMIVLSGAGMENFLQDVIPGSVPCADASTGIPLLESSHHHEHDHGHEHHNAEPDAHIWLSPMNAITMAENICQALCKQYPQYQELFSLNLQNLTYELEKLQLYGETELNDLSCRELITFHDGFAYLAQAFDLTILEAIEEESGSEASAAELIHLIDLVRHHDLPAIFTETNGSTSAAQIICAETGTSHFCLDMAMSGEDYFQAMYHNIHSLKEALQ